MPGRPAHSNDSRRHKCSCLADCKRASQRASHPIRPATTSRMRANFEKRGQLSKCKVSRSHTRGTRTQTHAQTHADSLAAAQTGSQAGRQAGSQNYSPTLLSPNTIHARIRVNLNDRQAAQSSDRSAARQACRLAGGRAGGRRDGRTNERTGGPIPSTG